VGVVATGIAVFIGVILGLLAGFFRGRRTPSSPGPPTSSCRFPLLLFAIGIVAACSASKQGCFGGLIKPGLPVGHLRDRAVQLAEHLQGGPRQHAVHPGTGVRRRQPLVGASNRTIIFREVLPNLIAPIIVYATLLIPSNIIFEDRPVLPGLGVSQQTPSWGRSSPTRGDLPVRGG
jgi:ABC-type dipeptide/oligopeptide/nickel transport system permease subunit